jgi:hypothetical protein
VTAYRIAAFDEYPPDEDARWAITQSVWAPFMLEDAISNRYWGRMQRDYAPFQFGIYDGETPIAFGNSIPIVWDGSELPDTGWDWALESGIQLLDTGEAPNTLCAISITVARERSGTGVSKIAIQAMRDTARRHGLHALVAPVRPSLKSAYPLTPMERYIHWTQDGEAPFDPWLRTHWRAGARILKVAPHSMLVRGSVADWETWARIRFPESGDYVVPGALVPVTIDCERDEGRYVEPNVWMLHSL